MSRSNVWRVLSLNSFFVRDAVKRSEAKTSDKLDLCDPATRERVLECREPELGLGTKAMRLFGGAHDRGTAFDLVATIPGDSRQVLRVSRGGATLSLGKPIAIFNHDQEQIGSLKPKQLALGRKFQFIGERGNEDFTLAIKTAFLSGARRLVVADKVLATVSRKPAPEQKSFFKEGRFGYAVEIAPELPANSPIRIVLLAVAIAAHRVSV
jgi:hypothetical protein